MDVTEVVAVIDTDMKEDFIFTGGVVYGNWLNRDALFDFDGVEIRNASDQQVERLCIAIGNDTDKFRRKRYPKMRCEVKCPLPEHTLRILRGTFGEVISKNI